jgi:hypothetical protein
VIGLHRTIIFILLIHHINKPNPVQTITSAKARLPNYNGGKLNQRRREFIKEEMFEGLKYDDREIAAYFCSNRLLAFLF